MRQFTFAEMTRALARLRHQTTDTNDARLAFIIVCLAHGRASFPGSKGDVRRFEALSTVNEGYGPGAAAGAVT